MIKHLLRTNLENMDEAALRSFLMSISFTLNEEFANEISLHTSVKNKKDITYKIAGIAHALQFNCNQSIPTYSGDSLLFSKLCKLSSTQLSLLILHISRIINEDIEIFQGENPDSISCWKAIYLETIFLNVDQPSLADCLSPLFNIDYFKNLAAEVKKHDQSQVAKILDADLPNSKPGISLN